MKAAQSEPSIIARAIWPNEYVTLHVRGGGVAELDYDSSSVLHLHLAGTNPRTTVTGYLGDAYESGDLSSIQIRSDTPFQNKLMPAPVPTTVTIA